MAGRRSRGERVEGVVQVLILLAIGSMAAAASFTHVHNVAAAHGQPGWLAWADAVVLELMSIATGLEIRRRHRAGQHAGFVLWVLIGAVVLSLSAQVVEAERSVVGWLAAALPAAGFLALVKIVLTRTPAGTPVPAPYPVVPETYPVVPAVSAVVPDVEDGQDGRDGADLPDSGGELLVQARTVAAAHLAAHGKPITRDQLRAELRTSTNTATVLHRQVRQDGRPGLVPVGVDAFTRANGATLDSRAALNGGAVR
jgi:hypothetical protein